MKDDRIKKLVELILDYSIKLKAGDVVSLKGVGIETIPYLKETYRQCLQKGAKYVRTELLWNEVERDFARFATDEAVKYFPEDEMAFVKTCDVSIRFYATDNAMEMANTDPRKNLSRGKILRPIKDWIISKTRWVLTDIPTNSLAQNAKMSLEEFEDFYFASCLIDYEKMSKGQEALKAVLEKAKKVRIVAPGTDLEFEITGMPAIKCSGNCNIPDGEVFTAPLKTSARGMITFNTPTMYAGKEFSGICLEFKDGKIIKAEAGMMTDDLNKILNTDEGARYVGEFAFGLNKGITNPMVNILFDEKIFGSFHFTPGCCYDDCDNGNKSAIHWDMVKILRKEYGGGEIWLDGALVQKDGKFVLPELEELN